MLEKIKRLQEEYDSLEKEVGDINDAIGYLIGLNNEREKCFAYTDRRDPEKTFTFKGTIDGKEVSIEVGESFIKANLEKNPKVDELRKLKIKISNIEALLDGAS